MLTTDTLATRLGLAAGDPERAHLTTVIAAVTAAVTRWTGTPAEDWTADTSEGATMLAARLHRRRNSPAGVEAFNDLGPVYVSRRDPDVAMLLGLGEWAPPGVA